MSNGRKRGRRREGGSVEKWPFWMSNGWIWGTHPACGEHKLQSQFIIAELLQLREVRFMLFQWLFTTSLRWFALVFSTLKPHWTTSETQSPTGSFFFFFYSNHFSVEAKKRRSSLSWCSKREGTWKDKKKLLAKWPQLRYWQLNVLRLHDNLQGCASGSADFWYCIIFFY